MFSYTQSTSQSTSFDSQFVELEYSTALVIGTCAIRNRKNIHYRYLFVASAQFHKRKAEDDLSLGRPNKRYNNHACTNCGAKMLPLSYEDKGEIVHHSTRVILPNEMLLEIPSYMAQCDRVRDLRSLACASRRFSALFVETYLEVAGFRIFEEGREEGNKSVVVLYDVNSCDAFAVWRRSHCVRPLRRLELCMSHDLGATTYMLRAFCDFLRSLPPPFSDVQEFRMVVAGPERMELRRLLCNIHKLGAKSLVLESDSDFLREPIYNAAKAGGNARLESISFLGTFPYLQQFLPWTRTTCSGANISTLRLTRASLPAGKWASLMHGLKLCALTDFEVDVSVSFDILMNFLGVNQTIQYLTVLQGENPNVIMDLTPGCAFKTQMPNLRCLDGPVTFQLAFLNHMSAPLYSMMSMVVRSDAQKLESWTLTKVLARTAAHISTLTIHFPSSTNGASFADMSWPRIERQLSGISTLILHNDAVVSDFRAENVLMKNLVKWISFFPSLREVEIHRRGDADYEGNLMLCTRLEKGQIYVFTNYF
ncbi:hypothetical protein BD410DRAFT_810370 [Rickenella mellea]|uniref:F-box domain-containing protein n=1 Tax=Rickenella mellea TaxID=50990 RepID=A0A4Y7PGZ8_9AGAM|nr:hypothetical protein BD410DRAFT_810370 [Rickenella mellea]